MISVCFVCLGNICRSPTAEAVFRHLVEAAGLASHFEIDSAGTAGHHAGEAPDARARAAGMRAGVELGGRARQFQASDFSRFDYVIAMDGDNVRDLLDIAPDRSARQKIRLLRSFDPDAAVDAAVPDPYYGDARGFDHVLELCRTACAHLLAQIRKEHGI